MTRWPRRTVEETVQTHYSVGDRFTTVGVMRKHMSTHGRRGDLTTKQVSNILHSIPNIKKVMKDRDCIVYELTEG